MRFDEKIFNRRALRSVCRAKANDESNYNRGMETGDRSTHGGETGMETGMELCAFLLVEPALFDVCASQDIIEMLDLGCGSGTFLSTYGSMAAAPPGSIIGLDNSRERCEVARRIVSSTALPHLDERDGRWDILSRTMVPEEGPLQNSDAYHRALTAGHPCYIHIPEQLQWHSDAQQCNEPGTGGDPALARGAN